jgi:hypothetical protein
MNKRTRKAIKTFRRKTEAGFLAYGGQVTFAISNATGTFPTPVPALSDINTELENFRELLKSVSSGNKVQITLKNKSRAILTNMISQLTEYVNKQARGSETVLAESCMDISKIYAFIKIVAPSGLVLREGSNTGELKFKCKRVTGAKSYFFQYSNDLQMKDATTVSTSVSTASCTFKGLTRSKTYYCRVAAVGGNKQLVYSNIVNRVCN